MEHPLKTLWEKPSRLVIGFMSGTSADGVDAALVRIMGFGTQTRAEQLGFRFVPFSDEVRAEILRLAGGGPASAADFCRMNFLLGELFCEAGEALCAQTGTKLSDIDLIGSHGQTFWHIPEKEEYLSHTFTSTFQLGEEAVLAERFGCPVVGNFRVRDMAAGGLGAPLVPYTEFLLYRSEAEHTALQNIGGIGNITLLPAGCALSDVTAFDTGPGNMLIDAAIARITNGEKRYDENGAMAASGRVSEALLAQLMRDPYLSRRPPKTTGREHYGAAFVDGIFAAAKELSLPDADILATVTDFTAQTIAAAIRDFCAVRPARLIVGGGGSRKPSVTYYTLHFETNGGSAITDMREANNTRISLTKYVPTRHGYTFIGWYSDHNLTNQVSEFSLTKNMTVYAGWRADENPDIVVNPFTDVSEKDWFYNDAMFVYKNGLMLGTSKTLFSPHGTATRGMMATILWRMEGSPVPKGKNSFTDVEAGKWYADAITWTAENGIFAGYGKDKFGPDDPITREQLAAIFYRYADYKGYDLTVKGNLDKFKDADKITDYAKTAMQWAVGSGLVKGKSGNLLDPQGTATRAEIAAMLHRFIEKYELVQGKAPGGLMGWIDPKRLQIPKTGDSSVLGLWGISLCTSLAGCLALTTWQIRRRREEEALQIIEK